MTSGYLQPSLSFSLMMVSLLTALKEMPVTIMAVEMSLLAVLNLITRIKR